MVTNVMDIPHSRACILSQFLLSLRGAFEVSALFSLYNSSGNSELCEM